MAESLFMSAFLLFICLAWTAVCIWCAYQCRKAWNSPQFYMLLLCTLCMVVVAVFQGVSAYMTLSKYVVQLGEPYRQLMNYIGSIAF